jgi:hypothetical protein
MVRAKGLILGLTGSIVLAGTSFVLTGMQGRASPPEQPIPFPHDLHSAAGVPCQYCHYAADRSPAAGIPSIQTCVGCHAPVVRDAPQAGAPLFLADSEALQELMAYWERGEPIPWVRIHDLPDHVRFTHAMHVNAGVDCSECHGPVEEMREVFQVESLQMGWCIDCHRERGARIDCFVCHY